MQTTNIVDENIKRIGELFPNCLTERLDDNGKPEMAIDFDQLRQELSKSIVEGTAERYQFTWPDKRNAIRLANAPSNMTLRPVRSDETKATGIDSEGKPYCSSGSVMFDSTENLYIEGDNLEVLKLMRENYLGKVKLIYIDPPYNTGSDFVYADDFSQTVADYSEVSGQTDENGNRMVQNTESNGRFHNDWLNMIYPRLMVAKDFLCDDGVICIQIDDNEYCNLKKVCDEIFGGDNFMTTIVVKMSEPTGMKMAHAAVRIPKLKEYILVYKKRKQISINSVRIPKDKWDYEYKSIIVGLTENEIKNIKLVRDNELRNAKEVNDVNEVLKKASYRSLSDVYKELNISKDADKEAYNFENAWRIFQTVSMTGGAKKLSDERRKELDQLFFSVVTPEKKMYIIRGDYSFDIEKPRIKVLFADDYLTVNPCDFWQDIKTTGLDNEGFVDFRNGKKPMKLIERIIQLFTGENDLIMDFFSGSGTTAHTVIDYNYKNHSNRKFIVVQLPELTDKKSEDYKAGFDYISEIGKERIRCAGNKILEEQQSKQGDLFSPSKGARGGIDIGFRVLKLDSSNMEDVYYRPEDSTEHTLFEDNIKPGRSSEDLLFQVMLECNLPLSAKIETEKVGGKEVFSVNDGYLMACFDEKVNENVIKEVAKRKPYYFVMRDSSLSTDNVADNFEQIWQAYSKDTIRRIL